MHVKICGITTESDAQFVHEMGAQFIGFLFAPSKRRISPVKAKELVKHIGNKTKTVGVFVNETVENMLEIAQYVGLDYIQLHGNEPASTAERLPYPIIKAFHANDVTPFEIATYPCDYYLIDSPGGGTGKTFDWDLLNRLPIDKKKLILAGGLNPNNVTKAIEMTQAFGVDVSSGVET